MKNNFRAFDRASRILFTGSRNKSLATVVVGYLLCLGFVSSATAQYSTANYVVKSEANNWQEISGTALTELSAGGNAYNYYYITTQAVTLPFNFRLVNTVSNQVKMNSLGAVYLAPSFGAATYDYGSYYYYYEYNYQYDYSSSGYIYGASHQIAAWQGIQRQTASTTYKYTVTGSAPNRKFIFQQTHKTDYNSATADGSSQVILDEDGSTIHFKYNQTNSQNWFYSSGYVTFTGFTNAIHDAFSIYSASTSVGNSPNVYIGDNAGYYDNSSLTMPSNGWVVALSPITLTSPAAGASWPRLSTQSIAWNSDGTVANMKLEYSSNSGSNWNTIVSSTPDSLHAYSWTLPSGLPMASTYSVRISDVLNSSTSQANSFTVSNNIVITSPTSSTSWTRFSTQAITWTSNNVTSVKLEYSSNGGSSWNTIVASTSASTGSYNWTLPSSLGSHLIRISDASDGAIFATSSAFTVTNNLRITSPADSSSVRRFASQSITWTSTNLQNVMLEFSSNSGTSWTTITASNPDSSKNYAWTVPNSISSNCYLRMSDPANPSINCLSGRFSIINNLQLSAIPSTVRRLATQSIAWTATNASNVMLEYSTNAGTNWTTITSSVASSPSSYAWTVPATLSSQYQIRLSDVSNSSVVAVSNLFSVINNLQFTAPVTGTTWPAGAARSITWTATNTTNLALEYSSNGGTNWNTITSSTAASAGSFLWSVPSAISSSYLLRMSDASNASINALSPQFAVDVDRRVTGYSVGAAPSSTFSSIVGNGGTAITLTDPDDGYGTFNLPFAFTYDNTSFTAGSIVTVNSNGFFNLTNFANSGCCSDWVGNSTYQKSILFFSTDMYLNGGPTAYYKLTGSAPNQVLTVEWPNCRSYAGGSATNFQIKLYQGSNTIDMIYKDHSLPLGSAGGIGLNGSTSPSFLYQRYGSSSTTATPATDLRWQFSSVQLTAPSAGTTWCAGSTQSITWNSAGVANVALDYSSNSGTSWNSISASTSASAGSYSWAIPSSLAAGSTYVLRVSDASNTSTSSSSTFSLNAAATIDLSLTPSVLWPPSGAMQTVTATVTVTGGCSPVYWLDTITSNEPLAAGDIQNASFGTADLSFALAGSRSSATGSRNYAISYRLSDGSGTSTIVKKVIVPRNLGIAHATASGTNIPVLTGSLPDPATASASLGFTLPSSSTITLGIYDVNGKEIKCFYDTTLYNASTPYSISWDLKNLNGDWVPNGVYFYQVQTPTGFSAPRTLLVNHP